MARLAASAPGIRALWGESLYAVGVYGGGIGVRVYSATGTGLYGVSDTSVAIYGMCQSGYALKAIGRGLDCAATLGWSQGSNTGVFGYSSTDSMFELPASAIKTGVYGLADQGSGSTGVTGESPTGTGVLATTTTETALQVNGKPLFSRSGRLSIPKGKAYADIKVAGGLTAGSVVHATLQTYRAGVGIAAVRANYPVAGDARIYLTKVASATASTSVGWFVAEY